MMTGRDYDITSSDALKSVDNILRQQLDRR